jgi:hypothetical protein
VKQKPRVVEEHDSMAGILSSVEAGTGVAFGADIFGYDHFCGDHIFHCLLPVCFEVGSVLYRLV